MVAANLALFFAVLGFAYSREPGLTPLEPRVFASLDGASLKPLKGNHSQDSIFMHYMLLGNQIEKVSAKYGLFKVEDGKLHVQLLQTYGVITGRFHTSIRRRTFKKSLALPIYADGAYFAKLANTTMTFSINLPKDPRENMTLHACIADVLQLELDLDASNSDDDKSLKKLKFWLRNAMLPSFSELFCEAMERVLAQGAEAAIVRALQGRLCQLLGMETCPGLSETMVTLKTGAKP